MMRIFEKLKEAMNKWFYRLLCPRERRPLAVKTSIEAALRSVGVDNVHDCLLWAFGPGYGGIPLSMLDVEWNMTHGDLFLINGSDEVFESMQRIGEAFLADTCSTHTY
jgi:hypothetical protein